MEAEREVVDDWQSYLDSKTVSRRRRRRGLKYVIAAAIILLLLLLIRCDDTSTANRSVTPNARVQSPPASEAAYQSLGDLRPNFVQTGEQKASWAEELFIEMQARKKWLVTCVSEGSFPSFTWHFSYQPQIGELLHRDFIWDNGQEPPYPLRACLQKYLERDFMPSDPQMGQWYRLSIHYSDDVGQLAQPEHDSSDKN